MMLFYSDEFLAAKVGDIYIDAYGQWLKLSETRYIPYYLGSRVLKDWIN